MARDETDYGEALRYNKDFKGPLSNRSCTDIICLLIFVVFLGCWGGISYYAISQGDLDRLLVPTNTAGQKCGVDTEVIDRPYLVFFNLAKCIDPMVPITGCPTEQVCVKECPSTSFAHNLQQCTNEGIDTYKRKLVCHHNVVMDAIGSCADTDVLVKGEKCAEWYLPSESFSKRCVPFNYDSYHQTIEIFMNVTEFGESIAHIKLLATINGVGQMIVEDIITSWWQILIGLVIAMIVCLIFIILMRWLAAPLIWLSIIGVLAMLGYGLYYTTTQYIYLRDNPPKTSTSISPNLNSLVQSWLAEKNTWMYFIIIISVVLIVILLMLLVLRKRIIIAIALVKEGSKAVSSTTSSVFFPIFPWILQVAVIVFAIIIGLYLASVGEQQYEITDFNKASCICTGSAAHYENGVACQPDIFKKHCVSTMSQATRFLRQDIGGDGCQRGCQFKQIQHPTVIPYFQAVNVIGFFWVVFFISALGEMVLAATFATWYWTFEKSNVPFFTLTVGLGRTVRYHLGTLAFGSLIVTICRIIRVILEYIDQKLKKYDNAVTRAIMCCLKCFFWMLEKFLRFLNKNAYIMCAIHGKSFCASARDAFNLLMRNFLRVIALDKVTDFLFFLTKVLATVGMGALTYLYFTSDKTLYQLHYNLVPVIIVMIGTYLIATVFFGVYSMAVDTLFLCFLEDCERNDGSIEKPYYMSKQLMKILRRKNVVPKNVVPN